MFKRHKHSTQEDHNRAVPQEERVELVRLQPVEAELVAARLQAAGIDATVGAIPVYESVGFSDGVPVFVFASDVPAATAFLHDTSPQQDT